MKTFCTLCPPTTDASCLIRDPGAFPFYLAKEGKYDVHFVSSIDVSKLPPSYQRYAQGMCMDYVPLSANYSVRPFVLLYHPVIKWLWHNAKKIDILNVYFVKACLLPAFIYRIRNPRGKVWLKSDCGDIGMPPLTTWMGRFKIRCFTVLLRHLVGLITVESTKAVQYFYELFPSLKERIKLLSDGVDDTLITPVLSYESKENIIVTVARFGTYPKNTELLLEVVEHIQWVKDWKVVAIGSIEPTFQSQIDNFFVTHPQLRERITFIGSINDRQELFDYYRRAKIFLSVSRYESFGIAMVEGLSMGDFLVTTPVSAVCDFVDENHCGRIVSTRKEIADTLSTLMADEQILREAFQKVIVHAKNFYMSTLTERLKGYLERLSPDVK